MGLDMYLKAKKYVGGWENLEGTLEHTIYTELVNKFNMAEFVTNKAPSLTVSFTVGYWTKSNQIHKWFVDNVQDGIDNCQTSYVSKEDIIDLIRVCEEVLADHSKAKELLPNQEGFFFGSTDYDEYYYEDLENTVAQLKPLLELDDYDFNYNASW